MKKIIETLIGDALAFAYASADYIDEDFAVSQLERIAHSVQSFGSADLEIFRSVLAEMKQHAKASSDEERAQQLGALPAHLGLE